MPSGPRRLRAYRAHGLYRGGHNPTLPAPGPPSDAARALCEQLIADHCGGNPSAAQQVILSLLASAITKHTSVTSYLQTLPHPWVDKRRRRALGVLYDLSRLGAYVDKLVARLCDPALQRQAAPVKDVRQMAGLED